MAYIEIKTISGREYKYLRKTVRDGEKIMHITLKYLGPVNPVYKVGKKRKISNASIYVRQITDEERKALQKAVKSSNAFVRDRAKIVLFSAQGLPSPVIAGKLSCDPRKVRTAIGVFNQKGLAALQRGKAPGAKTKFTTSTRKLILMHFSKDPRELGYTFTSWTLPRFRKHLIEDNVVESISIESVRQIIIEAGTRLTKSKRWQYSPDKEFVKKNLQ
jgi:Winged helix-turn helix